MQRGCQAKAHLEPVKVLVPVRHMLYRIAVLKHFVQLTGKLLKQSPIFGKFAGLDLQIYQK